MSVEARQQIADDSTVVLGALDDPNTLLHAARKDLAPIAAAAVAEIKAILDANVGASRGGLPITVVSCSGARPGYRPVPSGSKDPRLGGDKYYH